MPAPFPTPLSPPHHRFRVHGRHGNLVLSADAGLSAPWTVLFGPSGSGKSTMLRALAGLLPALDTTLERPPRHGQLGQRFTSGHPESRGLAYAPQGAPLFPHLSVRDNLRFPEALAHLPEGSSRLPEITALLQLEPLLSRRLQALSGGERQRVSLGRALAVPGAQLLLLDEPFAGLDRALRDALLPPLQTYLRTRDLPVLSVTHDPDEALLLHANVLRLHDGRLTHQGPAPEVLADEIARLRSLLPPTTS